LICSCNTQKQPSLLKFNAFTEEPKSTPPQHAACREFFEPTHGKNSKDRNGSHLPINTALKIP